MQAAKEMGSHAEKIVQEAIDLAGVKKGKKRSRSESMQVVRKKTRTGSKGWLTLTLQNCQQSVA
jgi:hypothetical protein